MSFYGLATGSLISDPQPRQSAKGSTYATASLRSGSGDDAVFVSITAFGEHADRLLECRKGDALSVSGRAELTQWTNRDGEQRHGLRVIAEQIASAKPRPKPRDDDAPAAHRRAPRQGSLYSAPRPPRGTKAHVDFGDRADDIGGAP